MPSPVLPSLSILLLTSAAAAQGSTLFVDLETLPITAPATSNPAPIASGALGALLSAKIPGEPRAVLFSDGTAAGTFPILPPGAAYKLTEIGAGVALSNGRFLLAAEVDGDDVELLAVAPGADGLELVRGLHPSNPLDPKGFVEWNGAAWFFATTPERGRELWCSDGTPAGTFPGPEIVPGPSSGANLYEFAVGAGGTLFFSASFPSPGIWALASPGASPTLLMSPSEMQTFSSRRPLALADQLVFAPFVAGMGSDLWISDGTPAGTHLVVELVPGSSSGSPKLLAVANDRVFFTASVSGLGQELYTTDGTAAGTGLVVEIFPGSLHGVLEEQAAAFGDGVLFYGNWPSAGVEPTFSDGTAAGTYLVADVVPGTGSSLAQPSLFGEFPVVGGRAVYLGRTPSEGIELWSTDGTAGGTTLLADLKPGVDSSSPSFVGTTPNGLVFAANDGAIGTELWGTDGWPAGTHLVANLLPEAINWGSSPRNFVRVRGRLFFTASVEGLGDEPWTTDGTPEGTALLGDLVPGPEHSDARPVGMLGDRLVFTTAVYGIYTRAWITDGTAAGTALLFEQPADGFGEPYFAEMTGAVDGLAFLTFHDPFDGFSSAPDVVVRTDGTPSGTYAVAPPWILDGSNGLLRAVLSDAFLVRAQVSMQLGLELYRWDGVSALELVRDIDPGPASSFPGVFADVPGVLAAVPTGVILLATTTATGHELWITDGTPAGTQPLGEVRPGTASPTFDWPVPLGGLLLFTADDGATGKELWRTDGTAAGTARLADVLPGPESSFPQELVRAGDEVFFKALEAEGGRALWRTDGTPDGTVKVASEAALGCEITLGLAPCGSGERVLFDADDPAHGVETWISDGTLAGTGLAADVAPGPGNGVGAYYTRLGSRIFFAADDGQVGNELHALSLIDLGGWVAEPFGEGCGATLGFSGEARLGKVATLELAAAPLAPSFVFASPEPVYAPLNGDCTLYLKTPALLATFATDGAGSASLSLHLPVAPALLGLELALQCAAIAAGGVLQVSNGLEIVIGS